jgi:hypothetical protein
VISDNEVGRWKCQAKVERIVAKIIRCRTERLLNKAARCDGRKNMGCTAQDCASCHFAGTTGQGSPTRDGSQNQQFVAALISLDTLNGTAS